MNISISKHWIQNLINIDVIDFCLCAGARNSPLVMVLDQLIQTESSEKNNVKIWNFFEERAAAFFAIGRSTLHLKPVVVATTSGTAVAELLPAVIEAYYTSKPLVLITADRPKTYRGKGAPQSIEQIGIFSHYCKIVIDIDSMNFNSEEIQKIFHSWDKMSPIQLNICFDEPLIDEPLQNIIFSKIGFESIQQKDPITIKNLTPSEEKKLITFEKFNKPLVIVSGLSPNERPYIKNFLIQFGAPLYLESNSGLKGDPELLPLTLKSGDKFVSIMMRKGKFTSIIRIGGVPTLRLWRDLEEKYKDIPVLSVSNNEFSGLSRESYHFSDYSFLTSLHFSVKRDEEVFSLDNEILEQKIDLIKRRPCSEHSIIYELSQFISEGRVYLGNSLPIRYWDEFSFQKHMDVYANRGANGIDGQISTFLGWSKSNCKNWCIVGDLTAMYDLASLWIAPQMKSKNNYIVIINNKGGQIFKKMFGKEIFINSHNISFNEWSKMWNWNYKKWNCIPNLGEPVKVNNVNNVSNVNEVNNLNDVNRFEFDGNTIIEINPCAESTELMNQHLEELWKQYI